jgi:hypothetical protein
LCWKTRWDAFCPQFHAIDIRPVNTPDPDTFRGDANCDWRGALAFRYRATAIV